MAYSLISNAGAGSVDGNVVTTSNISTIGADLIIAMCSDFNSVPVPVISNSGVANTWNPLTTFSTAALGKVTIFWSIPAAVSALQNFVATSASGFPTICVAAFSGSTSSPFDLENGNVVNGSTASIQPGSITPSQVDSLVVTAYSGFDPSGGETYSIDSGFTITDQVPSVNAQHFAGGLAYIIQTTALAVNPIWTPSNSIGTAASIASFKAIMPNFAGRLTSSNILIGQPRFGQGGPSIGMGF